MKTLFLVLLSVSMLCPFVGQKIYAASKSQQDIQIKEATIPSKPIRGRASCPFYVQAWIDYDLNSIEIQINESLGAITITLADMCRVPISNECIDSETMPHTMIQLPAAGLYYLTISSADYFAEGELQIE